MEKQKRSGASAEQSTGAAIDQLDCIHHSSDLPKIAATGNEGDGKSLLPDTNSALEFLEHWPNDRWVLTSIHPEHRKATTATFGAETKADATKWIEARQGVENIYFMVNPAIRDLNSKAKKTDVKGMVCLHVDVDPRAGEDLINEQERARRILQEYVPPPSIIVFSGGGYQGFWLLNGEQQINGDQNRIEELEAYNRKIELDLLGDHCHNVDRIMRLPGTINVPDENKRKKGRVPALAQVVEAKWTRCYSLDQFEPVLPKQTSGPSTAPVSLSGDLPKLGSVEDLPASVSDRIKAVIVQGDDPEDPTAYASRSEAVFGVACELVRAGVEDDVIASVLLDPDYGISAHCLAQPRSQEYATRQVTEARKVANDPELCELNQRHAVLQNEQGKTRVLEFVHAPNGNRNETRMVVSLQTFEDFKNRYMNRRVVVGKAKDDSPIKKPLGATWLNWENRQQYHSLVFAPGAGGVIGDQLNLWRGFAVQPEPGEWPFMLDHIRNVLAGGDEKAAEYILRWAAYAVQKPGAPAEVALVFRGDKGTGKGIFARSMMKLFGQHGLHVAGSGLLTGRFNLHLRDCCLLFADEVEWHSDRKAESTLKMMVTEPELMIEGKGTNAFQSPNHLHIIMASNEDWVVPASVDERRFAIFSVSDSHKGDEKYFTSLVDEMENGGLAAMLHDLLAMEIVDWHPRRDIPQTDELMVQKMNSLGDAALIVFEILQSGETPYMECENGRCPTIRQGESVFIPSSALLQWALSRRIVSNVAPGLSAKIGWELAKAAGPGAKAARASVYGKQVRGWWLPALPKARENWSKAHGLKPDWADGDDAAWDLTGDDRLEPAPTPF